MNVWHERELSIAGSEIPSSTALSSNYYTTNATLVCVLSYISSAVIVCIFVFGDRHLGDGAAD